MVIFNSYVKIPEGNHRKHVPMSISSHGPGGTLCTSRVVVWVSRPAAWHGWTVGSVSFQHQDPDPKRHHWHLDSNTWYWQRKKQDQPTWAHRKKKWSSGSQFPPERAMECRGAPVSTVCDVGILHYHRPTGQQPFCLGHTWFPCNKSSTTDFPSGHKAVTRGKFTSGNRRW